MQMKNCKKFFMFFSRKTLKPNSEILKSFDLKLGKNTITYTIKTEYQGTSVLEAYIYVYNNNSKIVISDIDGTITKYFFYIIMKKQ